MDEDADVEEDGMDGGDDDATIIAGGSSSLQVGFFQLPSTVDGELIEDGELLEDGDLSDWNDGSGDEQKAEKPQEWKESVAGEEKIGTSSTLGLKTSSTSEATSMATSSAASTTSMSARNHEGTIVSEAQDVPDAQGQSFISEAEEEVLRPTGDRTSSDRGSKNLGGKSKSTDGRDNNNKLSDTDLLYHLCDLGLFALETLRLQVCDPKVKFGGKLKP